MYSFWFESICSGLLSLTAHVLSSRPNCFCPKCGDSSSLRCTMLDLLWLPEASLSLATELLLHRSRRISVHFHGGVLRPSPGSPASFAFFLTCTQSTSAHFKFQQYLEAITVELLHTRLAMLSRSFGSALKGKGKARLLSQTLGGAWLQASTPSNGQAGPSRARHTTSIASSTLPLCTCAARVARPSPSRHAPMNMRIAKLHASAARSQKTPQIA
jgi:hypothetical protein